MFRKGIDLIRDRNADRAENYVMFYAIVTLTEAASNSLDHEGADQRLHALTKHGPTRRFAPWVRGGRRGVMPDSTGGFWDGLGARVSGLGGLGWDHVNV